MRILVVNDDGIKAPGIKRLVQMAAGLGEVWVVAPAAQCSAMSHRITVRGDLEVKPYDFPATGVTAYSVGGTPADCVKVALGYLMTEKPDIVFSGINAGYNVGRDILYSGRSERRWRLSAGVSRRSHFPLRRKMSVRF